MKSVNFIYWLQGFFEIADAKTLSEDQVAMVRRHLNMVFVHEIDPAMGDEKHQQALDQAHRPASEYKLPDPAKVREAIEEAAKSRPRPDPSMFHNPNRLYRC